MTQRPWQAEQLVSIELATAVIEEAFPDLAPVVLRSLGVGWDNTAYVANDAWVFRFPRREVAVELLETECALLPAIASSLPLPVPVPTRRGRPGERFRWPFAGYRLLPGRTACAARLDDETRGRSAAPLGRFLAALHAFPAEDARRLGVAPDTLGRMDLERRWGTTSERLARAEQSGLVADAHAWDWIRGEVPAGWRSRADTLVHGDLYARHVLVDREGAPCGVIDWGDVHLGAPAVDLALALCFLPPGAHGRFRDAYGDVSPADWAAARARALFSAAAILVYGHDVGDEALLHEAGRALEFLRAGSS